jgi:hypothetical protein
MVNLNSSLWFDMARLYGLKSVQWAGARMSRYSVGKNFASPYGQQEVESILRTAFQAGRFPVDPSAVYFVFTSQDVVVNGFPSIFCGMHNFPI